MKRERESWQCDDEFSFEEKTRAIGFSRNSFQRRFTERRRWLSKSLEHTRKRLAEIAIEGGRFDEIGQFLAGGISLFRQKFARRARGRRTIKETEVRNYPVRRVERGLRLIRVKSVSWFRSCYLPIHRSISYFSTEFFGDFSRAKIEFVAQFFSFFFFFAIHDSIKIWYFRMDNSKERSFNDRTDISRYTWSIGYAICETINSIVLRFLSIALPLNCWIRLNCFWRSSSELENLEILQISDTLQN